MKRSEKGSIAMFTVFSIAAIFFVILNVQQSLMSSRSKFFYQEYNKFALETLVKSSFGAMEAALKRRLWEMPPDDDCNRRTSTTLRFRTEGVNITVVATFDVNNSIMTLTATGRKQDLMVRYIKTLKIFDASDYLLYAKGSNTSSINLSRSTSPRSVAALIAGPRKVYVSNPIVFNSQYIKPQSSWWTSGVGSPSYSPDHEYLGTIIQSERMVFTGGIKYGVSGDNPLSDYTDSRITPYNSLGYDLYAKATAYGAVITDNYEAAITAVESVRNGGSPAYPIAELSSQIYPFSLFCGSPPLVAPLGQDTGCYNNSTSARYSNKIHSPPHGVVRELDLYCFSEKGLDGSSCSNSLQFPRGFNRWKTQAGLGNVLFSEERQELELNPITWENLEALKEDARVCGHYIPRERNAYTDCDPGDMNFLRSYVDNNGSVTCDRYSRINLDNITLPHFNVADYANNRKSTWFRRVIYSEVPIEIEQTSERGLWNTITNAQARQNMPIWIVTPEAVRLVPHQYDLTSPWDVDPGRQREMFFNASSNPSVTQDSLKLIFMTPEVLNIVSPQRRPVTLAQFRQMYPIVGGKIRPRRFIHTDNVHQEADGYRFGARTINLKNMVIISNPNQPVEVALTGLWSGYKRWGVSEKLVGLCMYADINANPPFSMTDNFQPLNVSRPSYAGNSVLPPASSRFYTSSGTMTSDAAIFKLQYENSDENSTSQVNFSGLRLLVGFEDVTGPTGRNLSRPAKRRSRITYLSKASGLLDMSERRYTWQDSYGSMFRNVTNHSCENALLNDGTEFNLSIPVNAGDFTFLQERVDLEFSNSGNFSANNVLMIRSRKTIEAE